jgi:dTDP-glucose 4,6-dehydratase
LTEQPPNGTRHREPTSLVDEFGALYRGRTVLVTGADGFMGSHLTQALVELGADVHAMVRATSSGALNNIGHLRHRVTVHRADLTDRHSIDRVILALRAAPDNRPYIFHLGAQAHVGESWHRPYETVMANTVGTLNLLQSVVSNRVELAKFDTAGTSEEYGNPRESVRHHHDWDKLDGGLILHERSPINPKSIYATAKVAADFLTMNYHDAYGVPGVVTRMFNNYGPRQNPCYITGTIITQALERENVEMGAVDPMRDFCFCSDGVRGHLTVAAHGIPGDVYCYGQGKNISMADWAELIFAVGRDHGFWGERTLTSVESRFRPGSSDVLALRVGYEQLEREPAWRPLVSWEEGVLHTIEWYAANRERWRGRVDSMAVEAQPEEVSAR